jgi:hypothetical protein
VICAPQQTCGGTANQGARSPTDLVVARLPRVAEALTLLAQGALWRFNGFPDPVGKVQSPALSKRLSCVFFRAFPQASYPSNIQGPVSGVLTAARLDMRGGKAEKRSEVVLAP